MSGFTTTGDAISIHPPRAGKVSAQPTDEGSGLQRVYPSPGASSVLSQITAIRSISTAVS